MFKKAERKRVKLKLGISGPSGSGKTYSALRIAKGLLPEDAKIALIDTENQSASLYADMKGMPSFDTLELDPPYTVDKYIAAINEAVKAGYDLLIVDSVSHVWSGEGGLLQEKETLDARGGNSFGNWAKMTPKWNAFVSAILHSDIHMICTMRAKQEHALATNDKGKTEVKKMGLAPQVRDGFEYELTAVFDMSMSHHAQVSKDRTGLFDGRTWTPDEKTGEEIAEWVSTGKVPEKTAPKPQPEAPKASQPQTGNKPNGAWKPSDPQLKRLFAISRAHNWDDTQVKSFLTDVYKLGSTSELSRQQYDEFCSTMEQESYETAMSRLLDQESNAAAG